jgi:hypothetical protein
MVERQNCALLEKDFEDVPQFRLAITTERVIKMAFSDSRAVQSWFNTRDSVARYRVLTNPTLLPPVSEHGAYFWVSAAANYVLIQHSGEAASINAPLGVPRRTIKTQNIGLNDVLLRWWQHNKGAADWGKRSTKKLLPRKRQTPTLTKAVPSRGKSA